MYGKVVLVVVGVVDVVDVVGVVVIFVSVAISEFFIFNFYFLLSAAWNAGTLKRKFKDAFEGIDHTHTHTNTHTHTQH